MEKKDIYYPLFKRGQKGEKKKGEKKKGEKKNTAVWQKKSLL